ncbi:dynein axonemal assembly factor 3 homolog [Miscanthus floridulus]|uniref:dynein axonemal assembly factor 3 homolog n=1 Tax=Miscanthus floridulus TaxID=154761 RepID=UPI003459A646
MGRGVVDRQKLRERGHDERVRAQEAPVACGRGRRRTEAAGGGKGGPAAAGRAGAGSLATGPAAAGGVGSLAAAAAAAAADSHAAAAWGCGGEPGAFLLPRSSSSAAPAPLQTAGASSALAAALVAARAAAADSQARVRAAALALERERDAADALARQIAEAEQLLVLPTSYDTAATSSARRVTARLTPRSSGTTRPTRTSLSSTTRPGVSRTSDSSSRSSSNLSRPLTPAGGTWFLTLRRYALDDHVLVDASVAVQTSSWLRLDSVVLSWIIGTISLDLHDLVRNC